MWIHCYTLQTDSVWIVHVTQFGCGIQELPGGWLVWVRMFVSVLFMQFLDHLYKKTDTYRKLLCRLSVNHMLMHWSGVLKQVRLCSWKCSCWQIEMEVGTLDLYQVLMIYLCCSSSQFYMCCPYLIIFRDSSRFFRISSRFDGNWCTTFIVMV